MARLVTTITLTVEYDVWTEIDTEKMTSEEVKRELDARLSAASHDICCEGDDDIDMGTELGATLAWANDDSHRVTWEEES